MSLSERQRLIAEAIDRDCDRLILSGSTEIECLGQMHDHMPAFKELLDAGATQEAADRCPGFHRFAKILEQVAIKKGRKAERVALHWFPKTSTGKRDAQILIDQHSVVRRAKLRGEPLEMPVLVDFNRPADER